MATNLNQLVSCETFHVEGREVNTNGKLSSELEVDVINGRSLPHDETQLTSLAKSIAAEVKKSLQDEHQFGNYKILFVIEGTHNGITQRSWKGAFFKSDDL